MATTYTNIYANSSLISYAGDWNLSSYVPLADGATASIKFLGGGVSWLGAGELGSNTADGGITTQIDAGSSTARNWTILGAPAEPDRAGQDVVLPFGRHTADFIFDGQARNFTFVGFRLATNYTRPADPGSMYVTLTAADILPDDQIEYYGETRTEPGGWTMWEDNSTVTYVEGQDTGFAFNFSGVGLTVYGAPNATADVDYSVYFNLTGQPPADADIAPFNNYTQKQGTGGVIFYVGAMPPGEHKVTFVNKGDTPLGLERAVVHWPGNYTSGLSACYVDCDEQQLQQLAGTEFGAGSKLAMSWGVVACVAIVSGLSTLLL